MTMLKTFITAVAIALFLTACGGGGGQTESTTPASDFLNVPPLPIPVAIVAPANLQIAIPALTYAPASAEHDSLLRLMSFAHA